MKINFKYLTLAVCLSAAVTSCDLEVIPPSDLSTSSFWKTAEDAWNGLNGVYAQMNGADIWDEMYTDNAHSHKPWEGPYELVQTNGITAGDDFGYSFSSVRIVNTFLANVDKCEMDASLKERMKAEARFFRAFSYLDLTSKFGKVPLILDVPEFDAPNVERDPVDKVQKFILDELNEIADVLPDKYDGGKMYEPGRITRAAALALRARAALYFGNFAEAEKSAGLVISEGHHSLFRITTLNDAQKKEAAEMDQYIDWEEQGIDKDKFMKGLFSYENLWQGSNASPANPEYILTHQYMEDDNNANWPFYTYIRPSQLVSGYSSYEPMQDLIDAYWCADGKTIPEPLSEETRRARFSDMWEKYFTQVNEETGEKLIGTSIPATEFRAKVPTLTIKDIPYMQEFRNRDSRLYASMLFPLKGWFETDFQGDFYYMWDPVKAGVDGNESWTGYSYRKMVALTPYQGWQSSDDYPVIRYAEVLLTYAEARIQTKGWDNEVQKALNDLRDRCGMPNVPTSLGKEDALAFVRNERRIELAGEGHRYEDIRRYGKEYCSVVMNTTTYAPCGRYDKNKGWQHYTVIDKTWGDRLMLMPIPTGAIDNNPLLADDQNPGY